LFKEKFALANYSAVHLLKSLTYFEDAEKDPIPDMLTAIDWEEVKTFLVNEVSRLFWCWLVPEAFRLTRYGEKVGRNPYSLQFADNQVKCLPPCAQASSSGEPARVER
jgi:hypothetical protein